MRGSQILFSLVALELTSGRVAGFDKYKIQRAIEFNHDLQSTDYPVTDAVFNELKRFVASKPLFKVTQDPLNRSRAFVERQLRFDWQTGGLWILTASGAGFQ